MKVGHMRITKSSADHFLGAFSNEESHGDLCFSPFHRPDTVMKLQSQTTRSKRRDPLQGVQGSKDAAKMTQAKLALVERGLGAKRAHTKPQSV